MVGIVVIGHRCPFKVFDIIYLAHMRDFWHFSLPRLALVCGRCISFAYIDVRRKPCFPGHPFNAFDKMGFAQN
jgi:hypothetical protein